MPMRRVLALPGDGIGQEVIPAAVNVLRALLPQVDVLWGEAGFATFQARGTALPVSVLQLARQVDGILFGATSSPSRRVAGYRSPILTLRRALGLCANIRPARSWPVPGARPGIDLVIVRENCEGLYVRDEQWEGPDKAVARRVMTRDGARKAAEAAWRVALARAQARGRLGARLTIVHKANVLSLTDGLFRETAREVFARHSRASEPSIVVEEMLVDTAALRLVQQPEAFDVILAPNLYGDILSDLVAGLVGGLGLAPSANVGAGPPLVEPVHGSAPDIAGQGIANPLAAILSVGLLFEHWGLLEQARRLRAAVETVLASDIRTPDLGGTATTRQVTQAVIHALAGG